MEFLHGKTLLDTRREQLEHFFAKSEQKECILRSLGGLAALDVFLNNTDRIPLIASNDGNGGNIMFSSQVNERERRAREKEMETETATETDRQREQKK